MSRQIMADNPLRDIYGSEYIIQMKSGLLAESQEGALYRLQKSSPKLQDLIGALRGEDNRLGSGCSLNWT